MYINFFAQVTRAGDSEACEESELGEAVQSTSLTEVKVASDDTSRCGDVRSSGSLSDDFGALDYGSAGSSLSDLIDMELSVLPNFEEDSAMNLNEDENAENNEAGEYKAGEEDEVGQEEGCRFCGDGEDLVHHFIANPQCRQAYVKAGEEDKVEENSGAQFLAELDKDYLCSPRLIVRGEYEGKIGGQVYKLVARRKTEGTFVDWSLVNVSTKKQVLLVHGEMEYSFGLSKAAMSSKSGGVEVLGGWKWGGWGYGYLNLNQISDSFLSDPRVLHIDIEEALFWDKEVYHHYHVCGPSCTNVDKSENIICKEGTCGLRIWSISFTTFTTFEEEVEFYRRGMCNWRKEGEVQTVYFSLVAFFNGTERVIVHKDARLKRSEEEVLWLSPVQNVHFDDSLQLLDRQRLERAKHVRCTRVPRPADGKADILPSQVIFTCLLACLFIRLCLMMTLKHPLRANNTTSMS